MQLENRTIGVNLREITPSIVARGLRAPHIVFECSRFRRGTETPRYNMDDGFGLSQICLQCMVGGGEAFFEGTEAEHCWFVFYDIVYMGGVLDLVFKSDTPIYSVDK